MSAVAHDDYVAFCEGVRALTKIDLLQYKRDQMERRMRTLAERRGSSVLTDYLRELRRDASMLEEFLDRVTINVSQLWRNPEQWDVLAEIILPELAPTGRIRAWSAGCSYGAEAYTLAALAMEVAPHAKTAICGTDIDARMIERARIGVFDEADARSAPRRMLERWFDRDDATWTPKPVLRALVRFEVGDLLSMAFPRESYDLVLCRNTVIYFKEPVRDALHARMVRSIRPGGWFVVGATERLSNATELGLDLVRPFTYRKAC